MDMLRYAPSTVVAVSTNSSPNEFRLSHPTRRTHVTSHWSYWGKALPRQDSEFPEHAFAYHSLDVVAVAAAWMGTSVPMPTRWTEGGQKRFPEIEGGYQPKAGWNPYDWMDDEDAPPNQSDCLCWLPSPEMPRDGNTMRSPIYRATLERMATI